MREIAITIDVEWAPEPVLRDTLEIIDEYGIEVTLFSTHDDGVEVSNHERALHPNYFKFDDDRSALETITELYPEATGVRSHGLYSYTNLRDHYSAFDIEYESNHMTFLVEGMQPYVMPDGMVQFPIFWMDDQWLVRHGNDRPEWGELITEDGLYVFDFHPPHVALNTPALSYYEANKENIYNEPDIDEVQSSEHGVRQMLIDLLEFVESESLETVTLDEQASRMSRNDQAGSK